MPADRARVNRGIVWWLIRRPNLIRADVFDQSYIREDVNGPGVVNFGRLEYLG